MELLINKKQIVYIEFKDRENTIFIQYNNGTIATNLQIDNKELYFEIKKTLLTMIYSNKEFIFIDNNKSLN